MHIHIHNHSDRETKEYLHLIISKLNKMAEKTDKALADLQAIQTQLQKIGNETAVTLQKVADLEAAANGDPDTPQSVLDKIAEVKTQAQLVDDLTPDAEPV